MFEQLDSRSQRLLTRLVPAWGLTLMLAGIGATGWAQQNASAPGDVAGDEQTALWSQVVERYEVVVLSRGLLLEPLDQGVELRTIEVSEDGIAVDGEPVEEEVLRSRLGDEQADLLLRLASMDLDERRRLFVSDRAVEPPTAPDEVVEPVEQPAAVAEEDRRRYKDAQVVVGNSLTVEKDEIAREVVVFGGPLNIYGKVAGDAAAIGGSVTVAGEVTGDVVAVGGSLTVEAGAEILGDAVSVGGEVNISDQARVVGQVIEVPFGPSLRFGAWPGALFKGREHWGREHLFDLSPWRVATNFLWETLSLLLLGLLACLGLLVARRPVERMQRRAAAEPWKAGLVGLVSEILILPVFLLLCLILVISIIGIPLVLLLPFAFLALALAAFLGFCGVALGIGRFLVERFGWGQRNVYLVLLLGVVAIQLWAFIGDLLDFGWGPLWFFAVMFGFFGVLIKYVAWTVGLGAAVLTRFGTAEGWARENGPAGPGQLPPMAPHDDPQSAYSRAKTGADAEPQPPPPPTDWTSSGEPPASPDEER